MSQMQTGGKDVSGGQTFGSLLRGHRFAANLTQEELAERAAMSAQAISALERGDRRAPRPSTVESLAAALGLNMQQKGALVAAAHWKQAPTSLPDRQTAPASLATDSLPPHAPLPAGSRMPLAPNPLFVGRGEELLQIAAALRGGSTTVALGQVVASTGLGGLGKTQLAVELVHRYGRFFAGGVYWLSFASADEIPLQVAACAAPELQARSLQERLRLVESAWQSATPRLLVFDNCEEEGLLDRWRPTSGGCRVLVTSRRSRWSPTLGVTALPLDLLPRADSVELLRRYRPDLAPDDPGLHEIARGLGDLPLALHLAGSYLHTYEVEVCVDDYLADLGRTEVLDHASLLGAGLDDTPSPTHHVQGVAQTFALCPGRLGPEVDRLPIAILARMACMAPGEPVPGDLLARTLEDVDPFRRADGLRRLGSVGLVEEGDGWLRLHRLVVSFVRQEGLDPTARPAVARALIGCGEDAYRGHLTGPALAAVIPHLVDVAGAAGGSPGDERLAADLCTAAGRALHSAGDLRAARPWFERALATRERALRSDHPDIAASLNGLAHLLWDQGELAPARPLLERAVAIRDRALGPDHPITAQGLNDLGVLVRDQGELGAARPLLERALAIRERALGPDHADTAQSLTNLAVVVRDQGDPAAARPLLERALAIRERALGPDHPDTAFSLNSLARLLRDQGELAAARPLLERALAVRERALGPDHPGTAQSLNNLASLLRDLGELTTARLLLERALSIWERVVGSDHPNTAFSLNSLAHVLRAQGDLAAARPLLERVLDIRERVLGPEHPDTASSLEYLAALLADQCEVVAARPLLERALAIRHHVLGPDHPRTVATRRALAELAAKTDD